MAPPPTPPPGAGPTGPTGPPAPLGPYARDVGPYARSAESSVLGVHDLVPPITPLGPDDDDLDLHPDDAALLATGGDGPPNPDEEAAERDAEAEAAREAELVVKAELRPLRWLLLGMPLWFLLGVSTFAWPIAASVLGARLLMGRRPMRLPRGFGLWLGFFVWMLLSGLELQWSALPFSFLSRVAEYGSATVIAIWIYTTPRERAPAAAISDLFAKFWLIVVGCGWLAVVFPNGQITSPMERIAPGLAHNEFFKALTHPALAQVQDFLGYALGRPQAPFAYTNDWGAAYALFAPFFLYRWVFSEDARRRQYGKVLMAASLIPAIVSVNRGMALSLLVGLLSAAVRGDRVGRIARRALVFIFIAVALALALTPLGTLVQDRQDTPHSVSGRSTLYELSVDYTFTKPILGAGGPVAVTGDKLLPALGTQGQLWTVMVSQGFVGLVLFLGAIFRFIFGTFRGPEVTRWCNVVLIISVVQLPVYDGLPAPVHAILAVAALGLRERHGAEEDARAAEAERRATEPPPWNLGPNSRGSPRWAVP